MRKIALILRSASTTAYMVWSLFFAAWIISSFLLLGKLAFDAVPPPPARPSDWLPNLGTLTVAMRFLGLCAAIAFVIALPSSAIAKRLSRTLPKAMKLAPPASPGEQFARDVRAFSYLFSGAALALTLFLGGVIASRYLAHYFVSIHDLIPVSVSEALLLKCVEIFGTATVVYYAMGLLAGLACREYQ